jgi:hypothetical protein
VKIPNLKVVETLYETNARDIPGMLRRLADDIEAGEYTPEAMVAVMLCPSEDEDPDEWGRIEVFGWGDRADDRLRVCGILQAGSSAVLG